MVTIEDIAREAGVSTTTVSNVIHGRTNKVSANTVDIITEIIRERGYVPNLSARAIKTRSTKVVALINHLESRDQEKFMSDPFFMDLTSAVEKNLREQGYFLMIRAISESDELLAFLRNWNVEGVFMPGLFESEPFYHTLRNLDMPVVLTDLYARGATIVSNEKGYGIYFRREDTLYFVELMAEDDRSAEVLMEAAREKEVIVERAVITVGAAQNLFLGEGTRQDYGMIRFDAEPFDVEESYMRLMMES